MESNAAHLLSLAETLKSQGRLDEAIAAYRRAIAVRPDFAIAYYNAGNLLTEQGKLDEAIVSYERATAIRPDFAAAWFNLGNSLMRQGKLDEAVSSYRRAIAANPNFVAAHCNLGKALQDVCRLDEAVNVYRRAIQINPNFAAAYCNLAHVLTVQGKLDEAIISNRRALAIRPDFTTAHSNLLLTLNYHDKLTPEQLFAEHLEWARRFEPQAARPVAYANNCDAARKLKIGYVSPDLYRHSVSYFLEPLLEEHDRQVVEIYCYADVPRPDAVTAALQRLADHWLITVGLSDDELSNRIREDGIDILVDLAGHTAGNRLATFARKPAPVQVTWLGYPNTTGMKAIDYRLVDAITDPIGEGDALARETLVRLSGGFLCYGGLKDAAEPRPLPCSETGIVTFGSFNNPAKLSDATLHAWAALLARTPGSRLLLKGMPFGDDATRSLFLTRLGDHGVNAERVELLGQLPDVSAHLETYHRIDIALDPFPYNGATSTCEALWMGVPVITLRGDRHAGRVGASLLSGIGFPELIADSVDEYVEIGRSLAADTGRLREFRRCLRPRMAASPLCDSRAFARKIEAAFRHMWQIWSEAPRRQIC